MNTSSFLLALLFAGSVLTPVAAQPAAAPPSAQEMIDALKTPPQGATRQLRIQKVDPPAASPAAVNSPQPAPAAVTSPQPAGALRVEPTAQRPALSLLIQFEFDSAQVSDVSQQALNNLAQALKSGELVSSRFALEGHTDRKGSASYNLRLSQSRADAVRGYLVQQGVDGKRLVATGKGFSQPALPQQPMAAENRRVRVVNLD